MVRIEGACWINSLVLSATTSEFASSPESAASARPTESTASSVLLRLLAIDWNYIRTGDLENKSGIVTGVNSVNMDYIVLQS
jgi:hypothetical protein